MAEVEKYRTDLEFNADNVPALQRSTLNLADNFNAIYNQLFSNDFKLMDAVTKMAANFGATVLTVLLGNELAAEVAAVTKDSLFFTLLKKALEAAGVAWNFNNSSAWYICFGDLLGGLIIQGGGCFGIDNSSIITYPIAFNSFSKTVCVDITEAGGDILIFGINPDKERFKVFGQRAQYTQIHLWFNWFAVGK